MGALTTIGASGNERDWLRREQPVLRPRMPAKIHPSPSIPQFALTSHRRMEQLQQPGAVAVWEYTPRMESLPTHPRLRLSGRLIYLLLSTVSWWKGDSHLPPLFCQSEVAITFSGSFVPAQTASWLAL